MTTADKKPGIDKPQFDGEWVRLTELCKPKQWKTIPRASLKQDGYPVYGANGVIGYSDSYNHENETILVGCRGTCGQINVCRPRSYVTGNAMCLDELSEDVDLRYLEQFLRAFDFKAIISGSSQPQITRQGLSKVLVPVRPLDEQRTIADNLGKLSQLENLCERQLSAFDDLVKSRFVEMFGDVRTNPHRFEKCCLRDVARGKLSYGSSCSSVPYDGMTRYLRITDITDDGSLNDDVRSPSDVSDKYLLNDGDLLFARSGATVGKTYRYKKDDGRAIYAGYLIRLVPNTDLVLPDYLFWYTKTDFYSSFVANAQRAVAQPNINAQEYASLELLVPPLDDQRRFVSFATRVDKLGFDCCRMTTYCDTVFSSVSARLLCT